MIVMSPVDTQFLTDCLTWSLLGLLVGVVLGYVLRIVHEWSRR